jgi:hypothetical protein
MMQGAGDKASFRHRMMSRWQSVFQTQNDEQAAKRLSDTDNNCSFPEGGSEIIASASEEEWIQTSFRPVLDLACLDEKRNRYGQCPPRRIEAKQAGILDKFEY